ncbi:MAG TPA: isochorismatase family protein [Thermoanaerobaculia bacterium]|nr:isochorismatase family protein [Thermoanaerobaculia bacterium]
MRLDRNDAVLVVIDLQERLMPVIHERLEVERNVERLIRGAHILGVPVVVTEQYVKGLGATVEPLRAALEETGGYRPIEKDCFSAQGCMPALERRQALIAGVETHVCVYQTALDLLGAGWNVWIAADAVSSRTPRNRDIALQRLASEGARLSSTEMALFEMLVTAGTEEFRAVSKLVK